MEGSSEQSVKISSWDYLDLENFKVTIILDNCFKETYRGLYATFYCHLSLFSIYGSK